MKYLMHIGFDNSNRLSKDVYYFEYKGICYKLIQGDMKRRSDVLVTIVSHDRLTQDNAYTTASEFLSALSWENDARVKVWPLGWPSIPDNYTLVEAKCRCSVNPKISFFGYEVGYNICIIRKIETEKQRTALILFRDALSSNHDYLSFLLFWQIMEIGENGAKNAIRWIDETEKKDKSKVRLPENSYDRLPLRGKSLGNYLYDDCRNAIAHIKRNPGKVSLKLDNLDDNSRITISTRIVKEIARSYIINKLHLQKYLFLRDIGKDFPVYVDK